MQARDETQSTPGLFPHWLEGRIDAVALESDGLNPKSMRYALQFVRGVSGSETVIESR
jgi:hypothetical protein